jgi:hypothetical protein
MASGPHQARNSVHPVRVASSERTLRHPEAGEAPRGVRRSLRAAAALRSPEHRGDSDDDQGDDADST